MRSAAPMALALGLLLLLGMPSEAAVEAAGDTWVHGQADYRTINYGRNRLLKVRESGPRIGLIKFDHASLSLAPGEKIFLSVRMESVKRTAQVQVREVLSAWDEQVVSYQTRPAISGAVISAKDVLPSDTGKSVRFDITSLVAGWIENPHSNFGLAMVMGDSSGDASLVTREGGNAPILESVHQNQTTVSLSDGDYSDPVTAARNAFEGDRWCRSEDLRTRPCVMFISAGMHILRETLTVPSGVILAGAKKSETMLIAAKGLETAVRSGDDVRDLTIISHQDGTMPLARGLEGAYSPVSLTQRITSVAIRVADAQENFAFVNGGVQHIIKDCDLSASGGRSTMAIDMDFGGGWVDVVSSTLSATSASVSNVGVHSHLDKSARLRLTDAIIRAVADGTASAAGASVGDEGGYRIVGGSISAAATHGSATAVAGGDHSSSIIIVGTQLVATGPDATGLAWYSIRSQGSMLDGVDIQSDHIAISWYEEIRGEGEILVMRSRLAAGRVAIESSYLPFLLKLQDSLVKAPLLVTTSPGEETTVEVLRSILDGPSTQGTVNLSCSEVLGSDYQPLNADCVTP